eukprot:3940401-Rhodomonas_salina.2
MTRNWKVVEEAVKMTMKPGTNDRRQYNEAWYKGSRSPVQKTTVGTVKCRKVNVSTKKVSQSVPGTA